MTSDTDTFVSPELRDRSARLHGPPRYNVRSSRARLWTRAWIGSSFLSPDVRTAQTLPGVFPPQGVTGCGCPVGLSMGAPSNAISISTAD